MIFEIEEACLGISRDMVRVVLRAIKAEGLIARPLLLAAVGKVANHAGQATPYLTPLHGKANILKPLIANIRAALQHVVKDTAEQFKVIDRWGVLLRYVTGL